MWYGFKAGVGCARCGTVEGGDGGDGDREDGDGEEERLKEGLGCFDNKRGNGLCEGRLGMTRFIDP